MRPLHASAIREKSWAAQWSTSECCARSRVVRLWRAGELRGSSLPTAMITAPLRAGLSALWEGLSARDAVATYRTVRKRSRHLMLKLSVCFELFGMNHYFFKGCNSVIGGVRQRGRGSTLTTGLLASVCKGVPWRLPLPCCPFRCLDLPVSLGSLALRAYFGARQSKQNMA